MTHGTNTAVRLTNTMTRHQKIIALNDGVRTTFEGGIVLLSLGVLKVTNQNTEELKKTLAAYNRFEGPQDEHDYGETSFRGKQIVWDIGSYDKALEDLSPDPANPNVTARFMTVYLKDEA